MHYALLPVLAVLLSCGTVAAATLKVVPGNGNQIGRAHV